jgi:2-polyprenyl-3-methyl-5-hydroxy-6-metoxy-1,4-benzoquinol methylase
VSRKSTIEVSTDRPCPICNSAQRRFLYHQRFLEPDGSGFMGGYVVCACKACGFTYADGVPPQQTLDDHYRQRSKYEHADKAGRESPEDRARFEEAADTLERIFPNPNIKILEVGASTGGFLAVMKERGYDRLLGLDPSPACAQTARRLYDVRVEVGALGDISHEEAPFDLIVALAVLEHIRDLRSFLEILLSPLGPGGALFVQVPDAGRFTDYAGAPFQEFSTEHINYFSEVSLKNLLARAGMGQQFVERTCVKESHGAITPVLNALFHRCSEEPSSLEPDAVSAPALTSYIERSQSIDVHLRPLLTAVAAQSRSILVWGAGTHTQRLLAEGGLEGINIAAYVDSNPHLQGRTLGGKPILRPGALKGRPEPILISSQVFQREIEILIRETLKLPNEIITLYPR